MSAPLAESVPLSDQQGQRRELRIAYILHRFPYLTETFIMREMYWLRDHDVDLHIFSLLPSKHAIVHEEAKALLPLTRYSPYLSLQIIAAQLYFLFRRPLRYFRSLFKTILQTCREPLVLARALAIFPKSVLFARQMQELEIQHAHAHFVWLEGIAAGIAAELTGITFTVHPHAFGLFARNQRDVRNELENATKVVTVSTYHRDYICNLCPRIHPEHVDIVHYGVNTDAFHPGPDRTPNEPIRILTVGRLAEKKGHEFMVDACDLLARRGIAFQYDIVGAGRLKSALSERIERQGLQKQVNLLGALGQQEILTLYQTCDIFALACTAARNGDQDGMPNALIEAMACGLPVVTTAIAGIPDLVRDRENGLLVQQRNATDLADALERLGADPALRARLGSQARRTIVERFDVRTNAAMLSRIFRRVVQSHGADPRRRNTSST